jgi:hypothetical protein
MARRRPSPEDRLMRDRARKDIFRAVQLHLIHGSLPPIKRRALNVAVAIARHQGLVPERTLILAGFRPTRR